MESVCAIFHQALEGLQFLHSHGIVHRDLRSENIMVEKVDPIHVRIIDLGLSHVFSEAISSRGGALYKHLSMMCSTVEGVVSTGPIQVGGHARQALSASSAS